MFPPAHSLTLSPSTYIALNGKTSTSETQGWAILKRPRPGVSSISFPNLAPSGACPDSNHCCKSKVHCSQAAQPFFPSTNTARGAERKSSQSFLPRISNSTNESPIAIEIKNQTTKSWPFFQFAPQSPPTIVAWQVRSTSEGDRPASMLLIDHI